MNLEGIIGDLMRVMMFRMVGVSLLSFFSRMLVSKLSTALFSSYLVTVADMVCMDLGIFRMVIG